MRNQYTTKKQAFNSTPPLLLFALLLIICAFNGYSQVTVPFAPRTSTATPSKTVYSVKGDFSMIGNTNLTLASYGNNINNNSDMIYVDVDNDANTLNSSSATLNFSTENGAIPSCANIIYAGLYWTGRASNTGSSADIFTVTKNIGGTNVTKTFDKRKVSIKGPTSGTYTNVTANSTSLVNKNIYFPSGTEGNMYSAYAEITDYVKTNGLGEYFVADIATVEGNGGNTGYYGGWGMVVVYENSLMKWRDVTVFDGHAYVQGSTTVNYTFDVNGFNTAQSGAVNLKLGVMAGEGDVGVPGDYFQILRQDNGTYQPLSHSSNSTTNFFNSSINTGGNARNPNLVNNTGIDISMFNINNANNGVITNNQTQTRFRYGSTQDTYIIFNVTFSVDSYVPEVTGVITNTSINGNPNPVPIIIEPGQFAEYKLEIKNAGTEATNNTVITIPLPETVNPSDLNILFNTNFTPLSSDYSDPLYVAGAGTNGSIVWNLGTLPLPTDPNTVLADISFKLTATTDCSKLGDIINPPTISLFGSISGVGDISNVSFNTPLIQGFSVDDTCKDNPIPIPIIIDIDNTNYVNSPPTITAPSILDLEGCDENNITASTARYPYSAIESADIKDTYVSAGYTVSSDAAIISITYIDAIIQNSNCTPSVTRTYTITNSCGYTGTAIQTINVIDTTDPVLSIPVDTNAQCSDDLSPTALGNASATDNCDTSPVITFSDAIAAGSCAGNYIITRTWTATDECSNDVSANQTITITDSTDPVLAGLPASAISVDCNAIPAAANVTATDNCDSDVPVIFTEVSNTVVDGCGEIVRKWDAADDCGNSASFTQTITVTDSTDPVLAGLPAATISVDCNAIPANASVTATDNCDSDVPVIFTEVSNTVVDGCGEIVRKWDVADACGNSVSFTQTITVTDSTDPVFIEILPVNLTVECDNIPAPISLTATDNCDTDVPVNFNQTTSTGVCSSEYVITRTWEASDACGNSIVHSQIITVQDTTAPLVPINGSSIVNCIANAVQPIAPIVTDNCDGNIIPVITENADPLCSGDKIYTFTYTDCAGNTAEWVYTYTIDFPDFILPVNGLETVDNLADAVQPTPPTVTDSCGNPITPTLTDVSTTPDCQGSIVYTFNYTDCEGNSHDWTYTYTVILAPFTVPADGSSIVNCFADAQVTPTAPVVFDANGDVITPVVTTTPADIACSGDMIWVFTYTDCAGNTEDWSYTYTIDIPDFTPAADAGSTVNCLADAQVAPTAPAVNDACGNAITPVLKTTPSDIACSGDMIWVYTYTDCEGNSHDWSYTYTIDVPDFTPAADAGSTVNCLADAQVAPTTPAVNDACGNAITPVLKTTPADIACSGDMIWVYTYTDCEGNSHDWSYTYTIDVPDFTPAADTGSTVNCLADAQVAPTTPAVNDACGNAITPVLKTTPADIACSGDMVWVYTYTDCEGNSHDWSYTYTIDVPDFILPVNGLETVDNLADAVQPTPPTVTDSCGNPITPTLTDVSTTPDCQGSIVYTFNYTDCEGNSHDWTYTYTIVLAPFTVPADESSSVECLADAVVPTPPTVFDANGIEVAPVMSENADPVCEGDKIYTFTYTDCAGNTADWIYTYNVNDDVAPVAPSAPANITFECIDDVPVAGNLTAIDNCSGNITVGGVDSYDNSNPCNVIITRTWTFTDSCGNSSAVAQVITVSDTTAPVAPSAPANITFECIDDVPVGGNLTAVDNCAGNITVGGVDIVDNSNPCNVIITRRWTFADDCGNTSSVVQTITVIDTTAPELTSDLDTDLTVSCANVPEIPTLKFADNCSSNVDVVFDETNSFDETILTDYEIIRTWTVSDACGNKNTYTQTLHVTLDEVVTEITADDKCYDDGIVDLNDYLQTTNLSGVWEMLEGNPDATLEGNIFNPTLLELSLDFKPGTGGIDYLFQYTTTDFGCISVTYVSMNINAECTVLPCGSEDVVISKAITPNGDQWNENFEINGVELCGFVMDVKIFNRWGALVFESHNYQNDWNGKSMSGSIGNAGKLPNGTYYYIIILKDSGLNPFTGPVYIGTK